VLGDRQESHFIQVRRDERSEGVVAHVTIDNPGRLNAMNSALMSEFVDVMAALAEDEGLRVVILAGAGSNAFIVGADIDEMAVIDNSAAAKAFIMRLHGCCGAIRRLPVPVIARIQGYCFGGGLEIAAACDVRIAADTATFGMQEVKLGIPSVIEAALLPMLVGWGRAREIMYLGETFSAAQALQWGLVEHVVPSASLDAAVAAWNDKLLTSKPAAVRLQKQLMQQWEELPLAAAVAAGIDAFERAYATEEPRAAMREFLRARVQRKKH
jgi:enoyl-CoA hydratase